MINYNVILSHILLISLVVFYEYLYPILWFIAGGELVFLAISVKGQYKLLALTGLHYSHDDYKQDAAGYVVLLSALYAQSFVYPELHFVLVLYLFMAIQGSIKCFQKI